MSDTPRTDARIVSQSFVDQTRMFHRDDYVPLLEHARTLERELANATASTNANATVAVQLAEERDNALNSLAEAVQARDGFKNDAEFLREQRDLERFRPMGDNHHNAVACPYCNPQRWELADPARVHYAGELEALLRWLNRRDCDAAIHAKIDAALAKNPEGSLADVFGASCSPAARSALAAADSLAPPGVGGDLQAESIERCLKCGVRFLTTEHEEPMCAQHSVSPPSQGAPALTYCGRCDEDTPTDSDGKCPTCTKYKPAPTAQGNSK